MKSFDHGVDITCCPPRDASSSCHSINYNWQNGNYSCNSNDITSLESNNWMVQVRLLRNIQKYSWHFWSLPRWKLRLKRSTHVEITYRSTLTCMSRLICPMGCTRSNSKESIILSRLASLSTAKRINSTQFTMNPSGWIQESDGAAEVRHFKESGAIAHATLKYTKF